MGAKIRRGDWWRRVTGEFECRDSVGWFERITNNHCPHFRLVGLGLQPSKGKPADEVKP